MDIVHHGAIGLVGFGVATSMEQELVGVFFLLGSILPDLDAFLVLFGKSFYLKNHQGFSHSFLLAPLYSFLLVFLFTFWISFSYLSFLAALLGLWIHVALDYSNTYGVMLFYPLSSKRFSLDAVFFIDSILLGLTVSMLWFEYALWLYILLFMLYVALKIIMQKRTKAFLNATELIPSALNPFDFYVYERQKSRVETYLFNTFTKKRRGQRSYETLDNEGMHLTQKSQLFQDITSITKALHVLSISKKGHQTIVEAKDLALRNFGGKFATTKLFFNDKEELINEYSNI